MALLGCQQENSVAVAVATAHCLLFMMIDVELSANLQLIQLLLAISHSPRDWLPGGSSN